MAELQKKTKTVSDGVVLTLSDEEANAVARALGGIAGNAREIERVWTLLHDNGFDGVGFQASKQGQHRVDIQPVW